MKIILTANSRAVEKGTHEAWVHVDCKLLLLDDARVSIVDSGLDPTQKIISVDKIDNVAEPLLWQLLHFGFDWKISKGLLVCGQVHLDIFDSQAFVLWYCNVFDIVRLYEVFSTSNEVLEKTAKMLEQKISTY